MPCIGGAGTGNNTLEDQAKYLVRSWYGCEPLSLLPWLGGALDPIGRPLHRRLVNAMENIPISIYYDWLNDGTDSEQGENNFGSVENAYYNASLPHIPKPAFSAASVLQGAIGNAAYTGRRDARVGSSTATVDPETFVLAFENNFVVWKINGTLACTRDVRQRIDCGTPGRFAGGGGRLRVAACFIPPPALGRLLGHLPAAMRSPRLLLSALRWAVVLVQGRHQHHWGGVLPARLGSPTGKPSVLPGKPADMARWPAVCLCTASAFLCLEPGLTSAGPTVCR
jgi:hypothetical protein